MPEEDKVKKPKARDEMTDDEFDEIMERGLEQAKAGEGEELDVVFDRLI